MDSKTKTKLIQFLENGQVDLALSFLKQIKVESPVRTETQSDSLFLWFDMIEHEAENAGVTWDRVIRHVNQLRVTKENLHEACKQLTKALWGITSTKKIKKTGQIDIIIDHFVELFGKEGLVLPEFPEDKNKSMENLAGIRVAQHNNLKNEDYPELKELPII